MVKTEKNSSPKSWYSVRVNSSNVWEDIWKTVIINNEQKVHKKDAGNVPEPENAFYPSWCLQQFWKKSLSPQFWISKSDNLLD